MIFRHLEVSGVKHWCLGTVSRRRHTGIPFPTVPLDPSERWDIDYVLREAQSKYTSVTKTP